MYRFHVIQLRLTSGLQTGHSPAGVDSQGKVFNTPHECEIKISLPVQSNLSRSGKHQSIFPILHTP